MALNLSIEEFQRASGLSDSAVLWLLKSNQLKCRSDPKKGLLICNDSLEMQTLVEAIARGKHRAAGKDQRILVEKMARIVRENMESIFEESIARVASRAKTSRS